MRGGGKRIPTCELVAGVDRKEEDSVGWLQRKKEEEARSSELVSGVDEVSERVPGGSTPKEVEVCVDTSQKTSVDQERVQVKLRWRSKDLKPYVTKQNNSGADRIRDINDVTTYKQVGYDHWIPQGRKLRQITWKAGPTR